MMKEPHNGCVRIATKENVPVLMLWIDSQLGSFLSGHFAKRLPAAESILMVFLFLHNRNSKMFSVCEVCVSS